MQPFRVGPIYGITLSQGVALCYDIIPLMGNRNESCFCRHICYVLISDSTSMACGLVDIIFVKINLLFMHIKEEKIFYTTNFISRKNDDI
jgi:hypothetical protein